MTTRADLVMPKLGLTMTEGKVARWAVAPGAAFAAADVVVVVETDKIAFDVEAPGAGTLAEILVPEGETVAVGTAIAHWLPDAGAAPAAAASAPAAPPAPVVDAPKAPSPSAPVRGERVVATPYARRLARNGELDLATVTAANGRRITAADVEAALARRDAMPAPRTDVVSPAAAFAIYGCDAGVDRLQRLIAEIAVSAPELEPTISHFVALAAARALGDSDATIALAHDGLAPRPLPAAATRRLSAVVAADRGEPAAPAGPVTLTIADAGDATFVAHSSAHEGAVLGVGAVTQTFRPDDAGLPVLRTEVRLVLTAVDDALPDAPGLLAAIRTLIENPLALLAS